MDTTQNIDQKLNSISVNSQETATKLDQVLTTNIDARAAVQNTKRIVTTLSPALHDIRCQFRLQSSTMATAEMIDRILTQETSILAATQEANRTVASMSNGVTRMNSQVQAISSAVECLRNQQRDPMFLEDMTTAAVSKALVQHREELNVDESLRNQRAAPIDDYQYSPPGSDSEREKRRRSCVLKNTTYYFGLVKIKVKTVEQLFDIVHAESTAAKAVRRLKTSYKIIPNQLYLSRGFILSYSPNPRFGIYDTQIQTVNFVPRYSPISKRAGNLVSKKFIVFSTADLPRLQKEMSMGFPSGRGPLFCIIPPTW